MLKLTAKVPGAVSRSSRKIRIPRSGTKLFSFDQRDLGGLK
jgi:hypothetical protein